MHLLIVPWGCQIHFLVEAFNGATKIANTPIPFAYIQILRTFLALIVYTLPFSLSETLAGAAIWATPVPRVWSSLAAHASPRRLCASACHKH